MVRPLWRVRACPMLAAAAVSEAIQDMGLQADTLELDRRTWLTHYLIDARIITAALDVAMNPESSQEARIYALRTLLWQKAPGHYFATVMLTAEAPKGRRVRIGSSYTGHYYTDLGYGTGEYPWPVLGIVPDKDYVEKMGESIAGMEVDQRDERLVNARAWFLSYEQDPQLAELLEQARTRERPRP